VTDVENDTERDIQASSIAYTIVRNTLYSEAYTAFFGSEDLTISGVHAFGPKARRPTLPSPISPRRTPSC
jgi:hypothetical protein